MKATGLEMDNVTPAPKPVVPLVNSARALAPDANLAGISPPPAPEQSVAQDVSVTVKSAPTLLLVRSVIVFSS